MLDESQVGKKDAEYLKCELCGLDYFQDDEDNEGDYEKIEETGRCLGCYEEWGDNYPDRV